MSDEPIRHVGCSGPTSPRWVLDDFGEEVIVLWCATCDRPIAFDEMSRELTPYDVPIAMLLQAPVLGKVN